MQNLNELMRRLISSQVEFVLVGGFAAVAHGVTLVTRDVDICCQFTDLHPVHRSRNDIPLSLTSEQCASLRNPYLKTDLGIVDCLSEILGVGGFDIVLKNSIELQLPYGRRRILDIDALIRAKEAMPRDHDRITVRYLEEIKRLQSNN
jgi:hypothetical protein